MAIKASDNFKTYRNPNGPTITTVTRGVIEQDGLYFKDIDGSGVVSPVNDWRLSPAERAAAYVKLMTVDEKIGQLFISDWRMGPNDVPGYDKDQYMPAELKDENGKAYAYRDANGNYYELNFGLSY